MDDSGTVPLDDVAHGAVDSPWTVNFGPSRFHCSACGSAAGNRLVSVPGEPSRTGALQLRVVYSHCGVCETLDILPDQTTDDDLYGEGYYSFSKRRGSGLSALRRIPARLRDRAEVFGGVGIGALLRRIAPNPLVGRLRPLTDGGLGAPLSRNASVLDIGCGAGGWLRMLAGVGFTPPRPEAAHCRPPRSCR
ncbi:MAG: hypothetical protein WD969_16290 [Paracoccaceae bacterium]